jgi:hypothetical protein
MELEAQTAYRGPDDPEDVPGQHLLLGRSVDENYRQVTYNTREAELWFAMDYGNFIDLAGVKFLTLMYKLVRNRMKSKI